MRALFAVVLLLSGCAAPAPVSNTPCKLYQPPRGYCAFTDGMQEVK